MDINTLKVQAYDTLAEIQFLQNRLLELNKKIAEVVKESQDGPRTNS